MTTYADYFLPFDSTGQLSSNHIPGSYTLQSGSAPHYQQITLRPGLFYKNDLKIVRNDTGTLLVEGTDYTLTYYYNEFNACYNKDVFAGIAIINKHITGTIVVTAHFVGGDIGQIKDGVIPAILNAPPSGPVVQYSTVLSVPNTFPVESHRIKTPALTSGFDDVVTALWAINKSILSLGLLPPTLAISQVVDLQKYLDLKLDNLRYNKIALNELVTTLPSGNHYLKVTTKLPDTQTLLSVELDILQEKFIEQTWMISGIASPSPTEGTGDYSTPLANVKCLVQNTTTPMSIYTAVNTDGVHFFIGPLAADSGVGKDTLSAFVRKCVYVLGIDSNGDKHKQPTTLALISDSRLPGTITKVSTVFVDNSHKHTILDISGLDEKLELLSFTTPYTYVDDPANIPEIKALSGYIFDCNSETYQINTPIKDRHDKAIKNGDTLSVQIYGQASKNHYVVLMPTGNDLIMGEAKGFVIKNDYSTTTFTLCQINGKKDWRITSTVGELDTSGSMSLIQRIIGYDKSYSNVMGTSNFAAKDNYPLNKGNCVIDLNGSRLTIDNDYKIEPNGTVTLIDGVGQPLPINKVDDILNITVFVLTEVDQSTNPATPNDASAALGFRSVVTINGGVVTEELKQGIARVELRSTGILRYHFDKPFDLYQTLVPEIIASSGVAGKTTKVEEVTRTNQYIEFQFMLDNLNTPKRVSLLLR